MKGTRRAIVDAMLDGQLTNDQVKGIADYINGGGGEKTATEMPLVVNQAEAARMLGVSRFTIRRLVMEERIHPIHLRGAVRYSVNELRELANV